MYHAHVAEYKSYQERPVFEMIFFIALIVGRVHPFLTGILDFVRSHLAQKG